MPASLVEQQVALKHDFISPTQPMLESYLSPPSSTWQALTWVKPVRRAQRSGPQQLRVPVTASHSAPSSSHD
jgi:hypothetical protein